MASIRLDSELVSFAFSSVYGFCLTYTACSSRGSKGKQKKKTIASIIYNLNFRMIKWH